jgi:ribosomal protein S13
MVRLLGISAYQKLANLGEEKSKNAQKICQKLRKNGSFFKVQQKNLRRKFSIKDSIQNYKFEKNLPLRGQSSKKNANTRKKFGIV